MKNMKMGMKIALGFGILIVIAVTLGAIGIWNMGKVETDSTILSQEYVPEVAMSKDLSSAANRVMYEMRGFGLTEDRSYYDKGMKELALVEKFLKDGQDLDSRAVHLTTLKGQMDTAIKAVIDYKTTVSKILAVTDDMAKNKEQLDESAAQYMKNCADFLDEQNTSFKRELEEQQNKIRLVSEITNQGNTVRTMNFKAQAMNDPDMMKKAILELDGIRPLTDELKKITRTEKDIQRINDTVLAADQYKSAMTDFHAEFSKGAQARTVVLVEHRKEMDASAGSYNKNCSEFLKDQQAKLTMDMTGRHDKITLVNDIIDLGNATRISTFKSMAQRNPDLIQKARRNFDDMDSMFEALKKITRKDINLKQIDRTKEAAGDYKTAMTDFLANWLTLQKLSDERLAAGVVLLNACETTANAGMKAIDTIAGDAVTALSMAKRMMVVGLIFAVIVGCLVAVFITRSITGPINKVIRGLSEASDQVASASGEVSMSSQTLAEGASEQAASIEETSSSLEEMSSMTKQNADNASEANNLMKNANETVDKANTSMSELITSMAQITSASEETSKIIKTIDEIAFQTNLLALNAAVEAARAGEAGAGFAVVADEVRNLALRAAEAAKNTASLIEGTVKKINEGSILVNSTSDAFSEVSESARKVGELVSEIAAASNEQAEGIEQVNKATVEMDKVIQQNAANAEESASASEEMSAQANQLMEYVGELVAMVGGTVSHQKHKAGTSHMTKESHHKTLPIQTKTNGKFKARDVNPSQVFPMDDDFTDF
ncbi:MAG: methyl-accepting chemotaxis protein [Proteobacteria bacterium]|nr:methyl-accepting chemotaxis protein [Pseudomonadota bacterium]